MHQKAHTHSRAVFGSFLLLLPTKPKVEVVVIAILSSPPPFMVLVRVIGFRPKVFLANGNEGTEDYHLLFFSLLAWNHLNG